jgi:hypothetical protein
MSSTTLTGAPNAVNAVAPRNVRMVSRAGSFVAQRFDSL